jgi:small redox-active disulfide protein 2
MEVKVLGIGCANCRNTVAAIEQVAKRRGIAIDLVKIEDMKGIAAHGLLSTPGVVIDGALVHAGGVPTVERIEQWFDALGPSACCAGKQSSPRRK